MVTESLRSDGHRMQLHRCVLGPFLFRCPGILHSADDGNVIWPEPIEIVAPIVEFLDFRSAKDKHIATRE